MLQIRSMFLWSKEKVGDQGEQDNDPDDQANILNQKNANK